MNFLRTLWQKAMRNEALRERLRIIIFQSDTPLGKAFDVTLLWCIVASIVLVVVESMQALPPTAKLVFTILEYVFTFFFTLEYLCRLYCSDKPKKYALSFFGIIDLLSTLPLYVGWIFGPVRYLMVVRTFRLIRVFRVFKLFSFLKEGDLLMRSIIISAPKIGVFFLFMVIMVISMGTLMYMVEGSIPNTPFTDIPTSIYWAVVTMTTVGYGDIAPATVFGRVLSAIVMLMGYTIMAVPTGIVSAQMVHDHKSPPKKQSCPECGSPLPQDAHFCPFCGLKQEPKKPAASSVMPLILLFLLSSFTLKSVAQDALLTGTVIGTAESVDYSTGQASTTVNTAANAFDGNFYTFFASYERSKTWVGLDLGEPHIITRVGWSPREGSYGPKRVLLALFEGANRPDFLDGVPLYLIDQEGTFGTMSYADVNVSRGFRYVRYIGPNDARCNIAEVAFYGHAGKGDDSRFYQLTNLPTLSFHTVDNVDPYDKVHEIVSSFTIIYADCTMIQEETGTTRYRGNGSLTNPKKPYRIKLDASRRMFKNSDMRSPAKARKWALINNHDDKTLMRNLVAFEIARRMGYDYVPWSKPVDVIVNGEYKGCYQLSDQLTVDKNRIDITEMGPADIEGEELTGGYLLELDGYASQEVSWFTSAAGNPVTIKSPDKDEITTEQAAYIRREFNLMEAKILASNFDDPAVGFRSKLDETSLLQYFLTEELAGNPDAFWSCYFTKERGDEHFHMGPVWDFDNAFDNDYRNFPTNDLGDYISLARGGAGNFRALLKRMFSDKALCDSMAVMWNTARAERGITSESLLAYIDSTAQELMQSQRLNFMRWPILNQKVQVNPRAGGSYEVELGWLKEYLENRVEWLDNFINKDHEGEEQEVVEIASAADLANFANRVNSGEIMLNAVLKADIDFTSYPSTMIGTGSYYKGEFDGAGHSVKLALRRSAENAGLFSKFSGYVHDLTTKGTITTSAKYAGGIAAMTENATVERCQSKVSIVSSVNGDGTHGGIAGVTYAGSVIRDCLISGSIQGSQTNCCGGVSGWASGSTNISGCLITSQFTVSTDGSDLLARNSSYVTSTNNFFQSGWNAENACGDVTSLTEEQVAYGEACFRLEGRQPGSSSWRQTLGRDATPVPDVSHGIVYSFSHVHCDGTPYTTLDSFTNDASLNGQDEHNFQNGTCQICGYVNMDNLPRDERGFYLIASAETLNWFADMVEQGYTDICGVLTDDIDFTAYPSTMIGNGKRYNGTFDGAGHTITIALNRNTDYAGLFGQLEGTVQDLTLRGTITTNRKFAGMVANLVGGTLLRCQSYIDINGTINGDGTHGGLAGLFSGGAGISQIQDCIFAGTINGSGVDCCGGIVGWASETGIISNCLMAGKMNISTNGGDIICRNNSRAIVLDTYYYSNWSADVPADAISTDYYDMVSGKLCYQLNAGRSEENQAWFQTLSEDRFPVPDNRHLPVWLFAGSYVNDSPDGIGTIQYSKFKIQNSEGEAIYNLNGQRVNGQWSNGKWPHGIYIINGRKTLR
ncbi:MAG: CotH kinase family protein [Bacteroidaceae bacterium]|nr:CotH kinase family protein [Bacteroidaceae bacterium]